MTQNDAYIIDDIMERTARSFASDAYFVVGHLGEDEYCEESAEFTCAPCELCAPLRDGGRLAGERKCIGLVSPSSLEGDDEPVWYSVCIDCFDWVAFGLEAVDTEVTR